MNGKPVLQVAFQYIPAMLASHDWRLKHAGLMAIASLAEGGAKVWFLALLFWYHCGFTNLIFTCGLGDDQRACDCRKVRFP